MKKITTISLFLLFTTVIPCFPSDWNEFPVAEERSSLSSGLSLEEINKKNEKHQRSNRTIWGMVENRTHSKYFSCIKAFGHNKFCRCLSSELPVRISFEEYISIVSGGKVIFPGMSENESKKGVLKIIDARDHCSSMFKNK